ncbi:MAG TPA: hypothetical protein PLF13_14020 [candidate division Zixibacteria bacterium]|nr:hypothetical protein [candidate division Zixibacteria bacterium]
MKKIIASAMVAALLAVMFASPVTATDYDPHKPPWAYLMQPENDDSGDDLGIDDPELSPPRNTIPVFVVPCIGWPSVNAVVYYLIVDLNVGNYGNGSTGDSNIQVNTSVTQQ